MTDRFEYEVTCRCGAHLLSAKYSALDVDIAVSKFNSEHSDCRKWPLVPDLERRVHDLELMTGMVEGHPITIHPETKVIDS